MAKESAFGDYLLELLVSVDGARLKSMFGGHGLFQDDVMFGLIADETLYLKVDAENKALFEEAGMGPFIYTSKGKPMAMSYYEAPPDSLEDAEALLPWATSAIAAARRTKKPKRRKAGVQKGK